MKIIAYKTKPKMNFRTQISLVSVIMLSVVSHLFSALCAVCVDETGQSVTCDYLYCTYPVRRRRIPVVHDAALNYL